MVLAPIPETLLAKSNPAFIPAAVEKAVEEVKAASIVTLKFHLGVQTLTTDLLASTTGLVLFSAILKTKFNKLPLELTTQL